MIRSIPLLAILATLQLALIGIIFLGTDEQENTHALAFTIETKEADRLLIDDGDKTLTLTRLDEVWVLPDAGGLAVQDNLVPALLDKIRNIHPKWPVADSSASLKHFEVDESNYLKRVRIYTDAGKEPVLNFYLGTSPGFHKTHLRNANSDQIYAVKLNQYDFNIDSDYWMDKKQLAVTGNISRLKKKGDWVIRLQDAVWKKGDAVAVNEMDIDQDKVKSLLIRLGQFRVSGLIDAEAQAQINDLEPTFTLSIETNDESNPGATETLQFYHREDEDDYLVRSEKFQQLFRADSFVVDPLHVDSGYFASEG